MTPQNEVPEYRVVTTAFFEPNLIEAGSRIRWEGAPGDHLEPLNAAAIARMEAWYDEEVEAVETATGKKIGKLKPHRGMQFTSAPVEEVAPMELLSVPDHDDASQNIMTLSEITTARKATNQRPGPLAPKVYKDKPLVQPPSEG